MKMYLFQICFLFLTLNGFSQTQLLRDSTFNLDGVYDNFGNPEPYTRVFSQQDKKLILSSNLLLRASVTRMLADGSGFDFTFPQNFSSSDDGEGMAIQNDGKIIRAGKYDSNSNFFIYRLKTDGTLDSTFGTNGRRNFSHGINIQPQGNQTHDVTVRNDGKIFVLANLYGNDTLFVSSFNNNGTDNTNFGSSGTVKIKLSAPFAVQTQTDGKIIIVGHQGVSSNVVVLRLNLDGTFDNSFDSDGRIEFTDFYSSADFRAPLAIQQDGKILVGGALKSLLTNYDIFSIQRINTDGTIDTSYDKYGLDFNFTNYFGAKLQSICVMPDGKIIFVGNASVDGIILTDISFGIANTDGSLYVYSSFGDYSLPNDNTENYAYDCTYDVDGKLVIVGRIYQDNSDFKPLVLKYKVNQLTSNEDKNFSFALQVYPNPITNNIYVQSDIATEIKISDIIGQQMLRITKLNKSHIINLEDLPSGLYILEVSANGKTETRKILKK